MKFKPKSNYATIVQGFSKTYWCNQEIYFKHFRAIDLGNFELEEERIYQDAHNKGLLTENEKIDYLKSDGLWSDKQELEIKQEKEFLEGRVTTKKNLLLASQLDSVNKQITESENKIRELLLARAQLVGFVVENHVQRKMNELHIRLSTYRTSDLNNLFFTYEEFNDLEDSQLEELIILYNNSLDLLNNSIKKLAVTPFFQNLFYLAEDNIYTFYGKSIVNLTLYQVDLFTYGKYFAPIINGANKPSQELLDDPDKLIEWSQTNTNLKGAIGEQKDELGGGSVPGAKKSDYKAARVEGKFIDFRAKLKPGQTEIGGADLANIFNGH